MNKENLKRLIDVIEKSKTFSMHHTFWYHYHSGKSPHKCGTPSCILGHYKTFLRTHKGEDLEDFLEISQAMKQEIIAPKHTYAHFKGSPKDRPDMVKKCIHDNIYPKDYITKQHAVRMLKRLLEIEKIDWEGTRDIESDIKTWPEYQERMKEIEEKVNDIQERRNK